MTPEDWRQCILFVKIQYVPQDISVLPLCRPISECRLEIMEVYGYIEHISKLLEMRLVFSVKAGSMHTDHWALKI